MGRGGNTSHSSKNGKKKWGLKMEELATMVERAQLEKIELNKRSKKAGKLSKKEYAEALAAEEEEHMEGEDVLKRTKNRSRRDKERGSEGRKGNGKGKGHSMSTSCPSPVVGYFPSNKGRSISFTGGPNFSYTQFHYTYSYEDNSGKIQTTSTSNTTMTTTTTTSSFSYETTTSTHPTSSEATVSTSAPSLSFLDPKHFIEIEVNAYEDDEDGDEEENTSNSSDDLSDLDENEGIPDDFEFDHFIKGTCLRFDGKEFGKSGRINEGENKFSESEPGSTEEESSQDSSEDNSDEENEEGEEYIAVTSGSFSHPDKETENALNVAYEKAVQEDESDDSDDLETAFGRQKRLKRLERDQKLLSTIQEQDPIADYPPTNSAGRAIMKRGFPYSTPQHAQGGQQERGEGPHEWPKKVNMAGRNRGGGFEEEDEQKGKKNNNVSDFHKAHRTRDKKKVQYKSKYVKYFMSSSGAPTAARGWVVGGTVKDDDLLHKFADISEPIESADNAAPPVYSVSCSSFAPQKELPNDNDKAEHTEDPELISSTNLKKSHSASKKRSNTEIDEQLVMTPKEQKIYEAILAGNFNAFDSGKTKKEKKSKAHTKAKSARYPSFDVLELAKLMGDCNDFVQNSDRSMPLYPMTKEQRIQVYSLASLYNFKKDSVGKGGNRSPVLSKNKKTAIPHCKVLAQFLRDCVETPKSLKALYLDMDENGAPPPAVQLAAKWDRDREREREGLGSSSGRGGERPARFVGENANPVGHDNIGNRMLRGMGWSGGGLGARGEGITEPIAQQMKFSRSGLG
eukprot:Phypoly_transcript_03121.p1 GENE.Phypoly_transcript_03121~~Phypoly_transcript_03121.p1  ORF type:complete len:794 (-),score=150.92 Phypoly_transcript_03121:98-2479(-)